MTASGENQASYFAAKTRKTSRTQIGKMMTAVPPATADGIVTRGKVRSPPFGHPEQGAEGGVRTQAQFASDPSSNGPGTQACAARGISTPRMIATRKSAGTSPNRWPRSPTSMKD